MWIGQDCCSSGEEVLSLDWWIHLGIPLHLPEFVVLEAGVRRIWSRYCSPQVLLRCRPKGILNEVGIISPFMRLVSQDHYCLLFCNFSLCLTFSATKLGSIVVHDMMPSSGASWSSCPHLVTHQPTQQPTVSMARTKQAARMSTGGKAPRKQLFPKFPAHRKQRPAVYVCFISEFLPRLHSNSVCRQPMALESDGRGVLGSAPQPVHCERSAGTKDRPNF